MGKMHVSTYMYIHIWHHSKYIVLSFLCTIISYSIAGANHHVNFLPCTLYCFARHSAALFLAITWMLAQCTKKAAMSSSTYVRNMTACTCCKRSVAWDDIIAVYWALTLVWTAVGGAWAGAIYSGFALASFVITAVLSRQVRDYKPEAGRYNELSTSELLGVSTADSRPLAAPPAGALPA